MHVICDCPWDVVIDNDVDVCDVEASWGEVSSDKDVGLAAFEGGKVRDSLAVFHEGVQLSGRNLQFLQGLADQGTLFAGLYEDYGLMTRTGLEES